MKQNSVLQIRLPDIGAGKSIVGPGIMEKDPVQTGHSEHHRIRGGAVWIYDQAPCPVSGQNVPDHAAKGVVPHFSHELNVLTQNFQGQTRIGHAAACVDVCRVHVDELARDQQISDLSMLCAVGKDRRNVDTDMARGDDLPAVHSTLTLCVESIKKCFLYYSINTWGWKVCFCSLSGLTASLSLFSNGEISSIISRIEKKRSVSFGRERQHHYDSEFYP